MSEKISQPENTNPDTAPTVSPALPDQTPPSRKDFGHISITQLTLAVLVLIFLWQWLDGHRAISDMQLQLAKKIAEMEGNNKANRVLLMRDQNQVRELSVKLATMDSRYAESQNQRAALENLYNNLSLNSDAAALAEVEQLLLNASQQLQLSANVRAALIAMQTADSRLQRMNQPAFTGLRQAINNDMEKLRALHVADITGINLQLNSLISSVDRMPLSYQQQLADNKTVTLDAAPQNEPVWKKLLREIWQAVTQLVRIEKTDKAEIPLLPPNQEFFLRENLKLSLLSARLALLSHDEVSFRQGLKTAQLWTMRYFDSKSSESKRMSEVLKKLIASDISIRLPDISASLQAVRNYRLTRENQPGVNVEVRPKKSKAGPKKRPTESRTSLKAQPKQSTESTVKRTTVPKAAQ